MLIAKETDILYNETPEELAKRVIRNHGNIKLDYSGIKLCTVVKGVKFPVLIEKTGCYFESDPEYKVTFVAG